MKKNYTISIYTENSVGLLNRISAIFQKRHINIISITSSASEIKNVSRFVIVVNLSKEVVKKVVNQIEKQIASKSLFEERHIQNIIKNSHAKIVTVNTEFFVIEKTGFRHETEQLYKDLAPYGLLQFVRSGRISVSKAPMKIKELLKQLKKYSNE